MPSFAQTRDKPESFGYKVKWFAVKASEPASVFHALELGEASTPANWASGLQAAHGATGSRGTDDAWAFASPPISGWVFVVGSWLPYPVTPTEPELAGQFHIGRSFDVLFSRLMTRFGDVQFFGSYRVVGFVAWARAQGGEPKRIFACADGSCYANFGERTPEEAKLGFANLTGLSPSDAGRRIFQMAEQQGAEEDALVARGLSRREARARLLQNRRDAIPDEQDVVDLAALWSIDPTRLSDEPHPTGLGLVARLPQSLRQ
jgi:hypothetical protein